MKTDIQIARECELKHISESLFLFAIGCMLTGNGVFSVSFCKKMGRWKLLSGKLLLPFSGSRFRVNSALE